MHPAAPPVPSLIFTSICPHAVGRQTLKPGPRSARPRPLQVTSRTLTAPRCVPLLAAPTRPLRPNASSTHAGRPTALRLPSHAYPAASIPSKAAGIDAYHALQPHFEKRMSHGLQVGASYTWSHATDEQSGLGLFYNG